MISQRTFWTLTEEVGNCIEWFGSFGSTKHPIISSGRNGTILVRRAVWEGFSGNPIPSGFGIYMTCRNHRCVDFNHMMLVTPGELAKISAHFNTFSSLARRAAVAHGARRRHGKLDDEKVKMIRASTESCKTLGPKLGVNPSLISRVRRGEAWKEYAPNSSIFTSSAKDLSAVME
jgi:hypothetical protein